MNGYLLSEDSAQWLRAEKAKSRGLGGSVATARSGIAPMPILARLTGVQRTSGTNSYAWAQIDPTGAVISNGPSGTTTATGIPAYEIADTPAPPGAIVTLTPAMRGTNACMVFAWPLGVAFGVLLTQSRGSAGSATQDCSFDYNVFHASDTSKSIAIGTNVTPIHARIPKITYNAATQGLAYFLPPATNGATPTLVLTYVNERPQDPTACS